MCLPWQQQSAQG